LKRCVKASTCEVSKSTSPTRIISFSPLCALPF
jgi:hypothetical protein